MTAERNKKGMPVRNIPTCFPHKFDRVHIELTNFCNFSCTFCPDRIMTRKRGFMEVALACRALDQIAEMGLARKVTFHVMGEPLMHPRLLEVIDHAHARGLKIGLTTNGALLSETMIRALAERDLYQIDVSLQTPDEESFLATRGKRIDFPTYQQRLLDFLRACASRRRPPIFKIRIMSTRFARKMREKLSIPDFMSTGEDLRRIIVNWALIINSGLGLQEPPAEELQRKVGKISIWGWNVVEVAPRVFLETYLLSDWGNTFTGDRLIEARHGFCFGMKDHFAILYNGDVVLCCVDFEGKTRVANLNDSSLADILNDPRLENIVKNLRKGKLIHPYCRRCLGSNSRLSALTKPALTLLGFKVLKPVFYRKYRLYE